MWLYVALRLDAGHARGQQLGWQSTESADYLNIRVINLTIANMPNN